MADLAGALDDALHARYPIRGIRTPVSQRRGLLARLNALEKRAARKGDRPGQAKNRAAAAAGISRYTWDRAVKGKQKPTEPTLKKIEDAYQQQIRVPAYRRKLQGEKAPSKVNVTADIRWTDSSKKAYNATKHRTVKFTDMGKVMATVIRDWVLQGPEQAADTFERLVSATHSVVDDADGGPGVRFEGDQVEVVFP